MSNLLTVREAARKLNIPYAGVLYRIRRGLIPVAATLGKSYLLREEDIQRVVHTIQRRRGRPSRPITFDEDMATTRDVARLSGKTIHQINYAVTTGRLVPDGQIDHTYYFLPETVDAFIKEE